MKKIKPVDPETLKIPAYMRKRAITSHARQQLILTALDRKDAGLKPNSKVALARKKKSRIPGKVAQTDTKRSGVSVPEPTFPEPTFPEPEIIAAPIIESTQSLPVKAIKLMRAGEVTHYIENINVAIILLSKSIKLGDTLLIEGENYIATQPIEEMQINRKPVIRAKKGAEIGLKVKFEAEVGGQVYRLG